MGPLARRRLALAAVVVLLLGLVAAVVVRSVTEDPPAQRSGAPDRSAGGTLSTLTSPDNEQLSRCRPGAQALARCGPAPSFSGISRWLNTSGGRAEPPSRLRGRVVLVEFLSYPCPSCVRHQRQVDAWYDAYRDAGLRVVGVASADYDFEVVPANVAAAVRALGIEHPVAVDPRRETQTAYRDRYWPASYLVGADGTVRAVQLGEGGYDRTERQFRALLREARPGVRLPSPVSGRVRGSDVPPQSTSTGVRLGWTHPERYAGTPARLAPDRSTTYALASGQPADTYGLAGTWRLGTDTATAQREARLRVRGVAREVYAVLAGTGTVTVGTSDGGTRTVEVSGRPGLVRLLTGRDTRDRTVDLDVSAGLRVYAVGFG